jgi:hypothetical protein
MTPRDWAKLALFYSQEIALDVATPGKEAADRAVRNAKLLRDATESLVTYWNYPVKELYAEIYKEYPDSHFVRNEKQIKTTKKGLAKIR